MHLYPLKEIPITSIKGNSDDVVVLRTLHQTAEKKMGYFMVRYHSLHVPSATFVLAGQLDICGRWLLGRIRHHRSQPGRFEILIRRSRVCLYRAVDTISEVAREVKIMTELGDEEFLESTKPGGAWDIVFDSEFVNTGFSESIAIPH